MIYIIGTGPMAQAHAMVLVHLNQDFIVIGRGNTSAESFYSEIGVKPIIGGIDLYLSTNHFNEQDSAIIAIGTEALMATLKKVLLAGAGKVLVEKPAAISIEELLENEEFLKPYGEKVFIAYNRRFYASVIEAMKLIEEDGGLESMHFEFTEWAHKIEPLDKAPGVKENWFFANSTHVVDLVFFIAGEPKEWSSYAQSGKLDWHPKTKFAGAGITDKGVLFSYHSNWESAGRWGIELNTYKRKIILRPLEEVQIQWKGSVQIEKHEVDLSFDQEFKPGLYYQLTSFLADKKDHLITLNQHIANSYNVYNKFILQ
jgi:predicted dehydrogenase